MVYLCINQRAVACHGSFFSTTFRNTYKKTGAPAKVSLFISILKEVPNGHLLSDER